MAQNSFRIRPWSHFFFGDGMLRCRHLFRRSCEFYWTIGGRSFSTVSEKNDGPSFVVNSGTVTKVRWLKGAESLPAVQKEEVESKAVQKDQKLELSSSERFRRMRERSVVPYLLKRIQHLVSQQDLNGAWRALCILSAPGNKDVVENISIHCINDMFRIFEDNNEYESICLLFGLLERVGVCKKFPVIYRRVILAYLKVGRPGSAIKLVVQKLAPLGDQELEEILATVTEVGQNEVTQKFLEKLKNENISAIDSLSSVRFNADDSGEEQKLQSNTQIASGLKTAVQFALRQSLRHSHIKRALEICEEYIRQDKSLAGNLAVILIQQLAKSKGYHSALAALEVFRERFPELDRRELLENLSIGLAQRGQTCSFGHYLSLQVVFPEKNSKAIPGHLLCRTSSNPFSTSFLCETLHFNREGNIRRAFELSLEQGRFSAALELFQEIVRFGYDRPSCFSALFRGALRAAKSSVVSGDSVISTWEDRSLALGFLKHPEPFVELMAERNILDKHDAKLLILEALKSDEVDFASFTLRERLLAKSSYSMEDYYLVQKVASICKEKGREDLRKKWLDISKEIFTPVAA